MPASTSTPGPLPPDMVTFNDIWLFYPNLVDYFRYFLCLIANFTLFAGDDMTSITGLMIILSFLLDIVDGKVARAYAQCSILGDGLDWGADLYIEVLLMLWWLRMEPWVAPWITLCTVVEIVAALFDFAIVACDRYPPRPKQSGFNIILEWAIPGGRYTQLGWINWLSFPFFVVARCMALSGQYHSIVVGFLTLVQVVLALPSAMFVWSNFALLFSGLSRWTERNQNLKKN